MPLILVEMLTGYTKKYSRRNPTTSAQHQREFMWFGVLCKVELI